MRVVSGIVFGYDVLGSAVKPYSRAAVRDCVSGHVAVTHMQKMDSPSAACWFIGSYCKTGHVDVVVAYQNDGSIQLVIIPTINVSLSLATGDKDLLISTPSK